MIIFQFKHLKWVCIILKIQTHTVVYSSRVIWLLVTSSNVFCSFLSPLLLWDTLAFLMLQSL